LIQLEGGVWGEKRGKHEMMAYKGPYEYDYIDPNNMLTMLWRSTDDKGSPRHAWKNDEFDKLCNEAGVEADVTKRMQMYQDAEKILVTEAAAAFLTHQVTFQIWWPYFTGMAADKSGNVVWRWLDIAMFQTYIRNDVDNYRK